MSLAATLACFVHGVSLEDIRVGLTTFTPSLAQTPGRLNFIEINDFTVLLDFAHNPAGFTGLQKFINKLNFKSKTGILSGVGDRRDEDLCEMGKLAGETFDKIIIRRGDYLRGQTEEEVLELLQKGIKSSKKNPIIEIITDSKEAIYHAFKKAKKGELVAILADTVDKDIAIVNQYRDELG